MEKTVGLNNSSEPGKKPPVGLEATEIPGFKGIPGELLSLICASVYPSVKRGEERWSETISRILPGFHGDGIGMGAEQGVCHSPCREEISKGFLEAEA